MIHFDISNLEKQLKELESKTAEPNFWEDSKNSNKILEQIKSLKSKCTNYRKLESDIDNILDIINLLKLEYDESLADEMIQDVKKMENQIEKFEVETLLSGKYDKNNAILTIHPGARWNRSSGLGRNAL